MKNFFILVVAVIFSSGCSYPDIEPNPICNGSLELCDKRYSETVFATTHNAFNYAEGPINYNGPNQDYPIDRQLADGVRAFMLDIYPLLGPDSLIAPPMVYHSFPLFGQEPLPGILDLFKEFLEENPEVILTIIFESYVTAAKVEAAFEQSELIEYLYAKPEGAEWPYLGEMVLSGKRLVVLTDRDDTDAPDWCHYMWDHATETPYDIDSRAQFDCSFNRGDPGNELFIFNHFVTSTVSGVGLVDSAILANDFEYLYNRILGCEASLGKTANFVTVDFYAQGGLMPVVDSLNAR